MPIAKSVCFLKAASNPVANSGREVPIATIVIPITVSDKPKVFAISDAPLINNLEPKITASKPITTKIDDNHRGVGFFRHFLKISFFFHQ